MTHWTLYVMVFCLPFLMGYMIGKYKGRKLGEEEGQVTAIINTRIKGLERGRCQLCGSKMCGKIYSFDHLRNKQRLSSN